MTDNNIFTPGPSNQDPHNINPSTSEPTPTSEDARQNRNAQRDSRRNEQNAQRENRRQRPIRRVGNFTMGIALIVTGIALTLHYFMPGFDIITFAKFTPLILVCLGIEILWANAHKGDASLKYDLLSMFFCFILICAGSVVSLIPMVWNYYNPERSNTEYRLQTELEQAMFEVLPTEDILYARAHINLTGASYNPNMSLDDLSASDIIQISIELQDDFSDRIGFATVCQSMLSSLNDLNIHEVQFTAENNTDRWELWVNNVFQRNASAEQLAQSVDHYIYYVNGSDSHWDSEAEFAQHQAELAQQEQEAQQQANASTEDYQDDSAETAEETTVYSEPGNM